MGNREYKLGMAAALGSAVIWGFLPIYWQALRPIDSVVIIFYRIVFVALVTFLLSLRIYGLKAILAPLRIKGNKPKFFLAGLLITVNWSIYIAAVNADYVIQTVIGYYIEPLMVSVFGVLIFHEKLNRYKVISLSMALLGVLIMVLYYGRFPVIALSLALTFAIYTAFKKSYRLEAVLSLFYETMFLVPPALIMVFYYESRGIGAFDVGSGFQIFLLSLIGICTSAPLILFTMGANRISMVNLGIIEYVSPSISLILGIFLFREPFDRVQFLCFVIIWIGLAVFTYGESKEQKKMNERKELFRDFPGQNRLKMPDKVTRVTAGAGGEALLISGSSKNALLDTGMAYCGEQMIMNVKEQLKKTGGTLDYILLSHTHYDHMGALPLVLREWPEAVVCGAPYCKRVFDSPGARKKMEELSLVAWKKYTGTAPESFDMNGLRLDLPLDESSIISLGEESIRAFSTKGHTDCSMTYALEPDGILFTSESTGVLESSSYMHIPILKSYKDSMESLEKCRKYPVRVLISPHYGVVPGFFTEDYWEMFRQGAEDKKDFIRELYENGLGEEDMLDPYTKHYWNDARSAEQPKEAFLENARNIIRAVLSDVIRENAGETGDGHA